VTERSDRGGLSPREFQRYSRHLVLPEFGLEGQRRLKQSSVLLVGVGGLGSPIALYLAAAGVGRIGLVDPDPVDLSNLQRQVVHGTATLGIPKVESARRRLADLNPDIEVVAIDEAFLAGTAQRIARGYDLIVDGTDNFPARYLINDVALLQGVPFVYGAILRFEGQVSVFADTDGPCYRCLFPTPPPLDEVPTCAEAGVLGVVPGTIGLLQATEVVKRLTGVGAPLIGRLLTYDALSARFEAFEVRRDPNCPTCGTGVDRRSIELVDVGDRCSAPNDVPSIGVAELKRRLDAGEPIRIVDVREPGEWAIARIPGSTLIPVRDLESRRDELNPDAEIVLVCRTGRRSARAVARLRRAGYSRVRNLEGGISAWATEVDPDLPVY